MLQVALESQMRHISPQATTAAAGSSSINDQVKAVSALISGLDDARFVTLHGPYAVWQEVWTKADELLIFSIIIF